MGVSTQDKIDVGTSSAAQNDWIVGQQDFQFALTRSRQRERQVLESDHSVIHASQPERIAARIDVHALIDKHADALCPKQVSNQLCVGPMVMIAEHAKNAVTRV